MTAEERIFSIVRGGLYAKLPSLALPLGSLAFVLFCTTRRGWGWENFLSEADEGEGVKFPCWTRLWPATFPG